MRTTIELSEDQRSELLRLAAQKGMKGFSQLIQEAVEAYLNSQNSRSSLIEAALGLKGALRDKAADEFEERAKAAREIWR